MAVPKRRLSKMRQKKRRGANRWSAPVLNKCSECGSTAPSHIACPSCGHYRDRQVLSVEAI
ncbi:MAG: 50S ribosomal protein L32 [Verrucomicrobiales bacterium]|nr:50S ribosomal protein L32 [Verrucomicrobiales bacterium]